MLEKILQKMKEQRPKTSNVSDRSLQDLAATYVAVVTTDEQLEALDFLPAITSIDGNINNYTAEAVKKVKKPQTKPTNGTPPTTETSQETPADEEPPAWAKALMEQNKALTESVQRLNNEKIAKGRQSQLEEVLKGTPVFFQKPIVSAFQKAQFSDDEEFSTYIEEVKAIRTDFETQAAENGMNIAVPGKASQPKQDGMTPILSEAREVLNKQKAD
jgi:hypothetical protein